MFGAIVEKYYCREKIKSEYVGEKWFNCPVMEDRTEVTVEPETEEVKHSMLQRILGRSNAISIKLNH